MLWQAAIELFAGLRPPKVDITTRVQADVESGTYIAELSEE